MVIFRGGTPFMSDHTASSAISAGDVVIIGNQVRVAHTDIANGAFGSLGAGGGVYSVPKATNGAIGDGVLVYWDVAEDEVTTDDDSGANALFGVTVNGGAATAAPYVDVLHIVNLEAISS
jgi:predicted RecA/RadA family phage recombinase